MDELWTYSGVLHGRTITLDENIRLPNGSPIKLQLVLTHEQVVQLTAGAWADVPAEFIEELERELSEERGRPVNLSVEDDEE